MAEVFKRKNKELTSTFSSGAADTAQQLSNKLGDFSKRVGKERTEQVVREEKTRGAEQGSERDGVATDAFPEGQLVGKPRKSNFSLGNQAYNQSLTAAYEAGLDNDMRYNIARIAEQNQGDVPAFNTAMDKFTQATIAGVPEALRQGVSENIAQRVTSARTTVQDEQLKTQVKNNRAVIFKNFSDAMKASDSAYLVGDKTLGDHEYKNAEKSLDSYLIGTSSTGIEGKMDVGLDKETVRKAKEQLKYGRAKSKWLYNAQVAYDAAPQEHDPKTGEWLPQEAVQEILFDEMDRLKREGLDHDVSRQVRNDVEGEVGRWTARMVAEKAASRAKKSQTAKYYVMNKIAGKEPTPEATAEAYAGATPEETKQMEIADELSNMWHMSRDELAVHMDKNWERADTAGELENILWHNMREETFAAINKAYAEDPLGTYSRIYSEDIDTSPDGSAGDFTGIAPNVLKDPMTPTDWEIREKVEHREWISSAMEEQTGIPALGTAAEVQALGKAMKGTPINGGMTANQKTNIAMNLVNAPYMFEQLDKEGAGTLAVVAALGDRGLGNVIFSGQEAIIDGTFDEKAYKAKISGDNSNLVISEQSILADELGDSRATRDKSLILKTAKEHYAGMTDSGNNPEWTLQDSIQEIAPTELINGSETGLPRGIDADRLQAFVDTIQPATLERVFEGRVIRGNSIENMQEAFSTGRIYLEETKGGKYTYQILPTNNENLQYRAYWDESAGVMIPDQPFTITIDEELIRFNTQEMRDEKSRRKQSANTTKWVF